MRDVTWIEVRAGERAKRRIGRPKVETKAQSLLAIQIMRAEQAHVAGGDDLPPRPLTRGDCIDAPRPCPYVSCKHHLFLDVTQAGTVHFNHPGLEPDELEETCSLDVADRGGMVLESVGRLMQLTRERIRQIEVSGLRHLGRAGIDASR